MRSRGLLLTSLGALLVGFVLRAIPVSAARPYMAYVDEGNFLHYPFALVRDGGWDPRSYLYPQFPAIAVTAAARASEPFYRLRGTSLRDHIPAHVDVYDDLEPFSLLLISRCLSLVLGLAIVVLAGLLARRLAGSSAGAGAALLAAVTPALVLRGPVATVDPYATFFVLVCAYLSDLTRTSTHPGAVSMAAGAAAGAAFASKYPAVLVIVAFGVSTLCQPVKSFEKARRLALASVGLILGAAAAMPALVTHLPEVFQAIRAQAAIYSQGSSASLWHQAFFRAEPNFEYRGPELGFLFVAFALAGLVLGLRDRRISSTLWGWCALAAVLLFLYGSQALRPFRNLLPLVPLACVAASISFIRIRQRVRAPRWTDAISLLWLSVAFVVPLSRYARARYQLEDPRKLAIDWLVARVRPADQVLLSRELGFLSQELARLPARQTARWWADARTEIPSDRPRFIVTGVLGRGDGSSIDVAALPSIRSDYEVRFRAGEQPTAADPRWWRGNHQIVLVLERISPLRR